MRMPLGGPPLCDTLEIAGTTDLRDLLANLDPQLYPDPWVFAVAPEVPAEAQPFAIIREDEGATLVVTLAEAERLGLTFDYVAARITLRIHSALEAVGMTAALACVLADVGLSCNVIAGCHHDHLFVPCGRRAEALEALRTLG